MLRTTPARHPTVRRLPWAARLSSLAPLATTPRRRQPPLRSYRYLDHYFFLPNAQVLVALQTHLPPVLLHVPTCEAPERHASTHRRTGRRFKSAAAAAASEESSAFPIFTNPKILPRKVRRNLYQTRMRASQKLDIATEVRVRLDKLKVPGVKGYIYETPLKTFSADHPKAWTVDQVSSAIDDLWKYMAPVRARVNVLGHQHLDAVRGFSRLARLFPSDELSEAVRVLGAGGSVHSVGRQGPWRHQPHSPTPPRIAALRRRAADYMEQHLFIFSSSPLQHSFSYQLLLLDIHTLHNSIPVVPRTPEEALEVLATAPDEPDTPDINRDVAAARAAHREQASFLAPLISIFLPRAERLRGAQQLNAAFEAQRTALVLLFDCWRSMGCPERAVHFVVEWKLEHLLGVDTRGRANEELVADADEETPAWADPFEVGALNVDGGGGGGGRPLTPVPAPSHADSVRARRRRVNDLALRELYADVASRIRPTPAEWLVTHVERTAPSAYARQRKPELFDYDFLHLYGPHLIETLSGSDLPAEAWAIWRYAKSLQVTFGGVRELTSSTALLNALLRRRQFYRASRVMAQLEPNVERAEASAASDAHGPHRASALGLALSGARASLVRARALQGQPIQETTTIENLIARLRSAAEAGGLDAIDALWHATEIPATVSRAGLARLLAELIRAHAAANDVEAALDITDEAAAVGLRVPPWAFDALLSAAAARADEPLAAEIFARRVAAGHRPGPATFGALLALCARRRDADAAEHTIGVMLRTRVSPRLTHWTALLNCYVDCGAYESAFAVFRFLQGHPRAALRPDTYVVNAVLRAVILSGAPSQVALNVFERASAAGMPADGVTYTMLMKSLCAEGELEHAESVMRWLTGGAVSSEELVGGGGGEGREKGAGVSGGTPPENANSTPPDSDGNQPNREDAGKDTRRRHTTDTKYAAQPPPPWLASPRISDETDPPQLNALAYTYLISGHIRAGNFDRAREWLREMQTAGIAPLSLTYGLVVSSFLKQGTAEGAERARAFADDFVAHSPLEELRKTPAARLDPLLIRGYELHPVLRPLLHHYATTLDAERALATYRLALPSAEQNLVLLTGLMEAYSRTHDTTSVLFLWNKVHELALRDHGAPRQRAARKGDMLGKFETSGDDYGLFLRREPGEDAMRSGEIEVVKGDGRVRREAFAGKKRAASRDASDEARATGTSDPVTAAPGAPAAPTTTPEESSAERSSTDRTTLRQISRHYTYILSQPLNYTLDALAGSREGFKEVRRIWDTLQKEGFEFDARNWNAYARASVKCGRLRTALSATEHILDYSADIDFETQKRLVFEHQSMENDRAQRLKTILDALSAEELNTEDEDATDVARGGEERADENMASDGVIPMNGDESRMSDERGSSDMNENALANGPHDTPYIKGNEAPHSKKGDESPHPTTEKELPHASKLNARKRKRLVKDMLGLSGGEHVLSAERAVMVSQEYIKTRSWIPHLTLLTVLDQSVSALKRSDYPRYHRMRTAFPRAFALLSEYSKVKNSQEHPQARSQH